MIQSTITPITACSNFKPMQLPEDFEPRRMDILCGRGRGVWEHEGNRRFKALIECHAEKYAAARTKMDKGVVIASMVDSIREEGILFVKKDGKTQRWLDIGEYKAREKTSHAMRDHIAKSSGTSRKNNTQQSNGLARDAVQKQRETKTTQQPTRVSSYNKLCTPDSGMDKSISMATPDIFHRLGLDYLSFFEEETKELAIYPEKVTSQSTPMNTFDGSEEGDEGLQWSELFPIEAIDHFCIQSTSYAYAA